LNEMKQLLLLLPALWTAFRAVFVCGVACCCAAPWSQVFYDVASKFLFIDWHGQVTALS